MGESLMKCVSIQSCQIVCTFQCGICRRIVVSNQEMRILFDRFLKKYYADIDVSNERMTINLTDEEGHVLSFNLSQSEVHYVLHMVERRLNSFMRDDGGGGFSDED